MMERTIINAGFRHSNSLFSFFVTGHARPQVCAAVSAVACGLVSFCLSHKDTVRNLVYRLNSGDSKVEFESDDEFVAGARSSDLRRTFPAIWRQNLEPGPRAFCHDDLHPVVTLSLQTTL